MSKSESRISRAMRRLSVPVLAVFGSAVAAFGQGTLVGNSPFMPTGSAAGAGAGPGEAYELAGSSVQGSEVSVCIYERQAKHSQWIPVGGLSDGIHVISYDALHDKAVVTIGGAFKELTLRKTAIASLGPPSVPRPSQPANEPAVAPVASSAPAPAASPLQEQREARMLVSDLLEIGVQQRKAYQDAKQKAASGTPAQPAN